MQPNIFSLSVSNKEAKQDFAKKVKIAKENAEKGKFAKTIQRAFRAYKLKTKERISDAGSSLKKFRDLSKVLAMSQYRKLFFLPLDKMLPLLAGFCNSSCVSHLKKGRLSMSDFGFMLLTLKDILACSFNFYDSKVTVANLVYNYLNGSMKAKFMLERLVEKLKLVADFIVATPGDQHSHLLTAMADCCLLLQYSVPVASSEIDTKEAKLLREALNQKLLPIVNVLLPFLKPSELVDLLRLDLSLKNNSTLFAQMLILELRSASKRNTWQEATPVAAKKVAEAIKSKQEIEQLIRQVDLAGEIEARPSEAIGLVTVLLQAILDSKRRGERLAAHKHFVQAFIVAFSKRQAELEPGKLQIAEELAPDMYTPVGDICNRMTQFVLDMSVVNATDDLLVAIFTAFKYNDDVFRQVILAVYRTVHKVTSISMASTSITMPQAHHIGWFALLLGVLKYRMLTSTLQEFLSIGPNLDKILHLLFYLQNYLAYYHILNSLDDEKSFLIRSTAEVIKQINDYNHLKQFFEPNRLRMCKLNSFLYDSITADTANYPPESLETIRSLLTLFPSSVDFKSRVALLGKLVPPAASAATLYAKVRRHALVEDCLKVASAAASNASGKIKIIFVDQFGHEEKGFDDGGLWKEFLLLALEKVDNAHKFFDPQYGLFMPVRGDEMVVNPLALEYVGHQAADLFYTSGWLMGRAVREKIVLPFQFSPLFMRNLSGRRNGLNQLAQLDEDMYVHICKLKALDNVDKVASDHQLCLTFTVTDEFGKEIELIPDGKNTEVNDLNKLLYIFKYVDYKVQRQFESGTLPFLNGFSKVIGTDLMKMFDESELAKLINGGLVKIDIGELRKTTVYRAGYAAGQSYIKVPKSDCRIFGTSSPNSAKKIRGRCSDL